jgi:hypothetical protein
MGRGAIGGLIGGIAMATLMMAVTAVKGMGVLTPLYLIAATFHESWAVQTGFTPAPILVGVMVHMVMSMGLGFAFVVALSSITRPGASLPHWASAGLMWGLIVLLVNQNIVLPVVDPALVSATSGLIFWWVLAHLMFGLALGISAALPRTLRRPALRAAWQSGPLPQSR